MRDVNPAKIPSASIPCASQVSGLLKKRKKIKGEKTMPVAPYLRDLLVQK